jgi:hypothetical protein
MCSLNFVPQIMSKCELIVIKNVTSLLATCQKSHSDPQFMSVMIIISANTAWISQTQSLMAIKHISNKIPKILAMLYACVLKVLASNLGCTD